MTNSANKRWQRSELTYCSNVHAGESFDEVVATIEGCIAQVRKYRGLDLMGSGLWLANEVACELKNSSQKRKIFKETLMSSGVQLFTLNGFPYGGFHSAEVKAKVYLPHWADSSRYEYTLNLAELLAEFMPDDCREGTISTVPIAFKEGWSEELQHVALDQLCHFAVALQRIDKESGRHIRLCLEMEPGCVLEKTEEAISLFTCALPAAARHHAIDQKVLNRYLGLCFDVCHQAVMFENPIVSMQKISDAGIVIGKIQLSNALELKDPEQSLARDLLADFVEPRYLHQVYARSQDGKLAGVMDLPEALSSQLLPARQPWRVHFHVPVQADVVDGGVLNTTQYTIEQTLDFLKQNPHLYPHLEVETYTWQVLPEKLRPKDTKELLAGLSRELAWVERSMIDRDLLE